MTRRYLFLCPDEKSASGGIAVIYDVVALLNKSGYRAAVIHNAPDAGYPDYPDPVPMFYSKNMQRVYWRHARLRARAKIFRDWVGSRKKKLQLIDLRPTDVIVAPEFQVAEAIEAFEGMNIAVFVQNPFSLMTSCHRASERGFNPKTQVRFWFGIADVCRSHLNVLGLKPSAIFPVTMKPHEFPFQTRKEKLITYMPRKRPWEAALLAEALVRRDRLLGYRLEALENMPRTEVAAKLARTRIFISLLKHEALGFPAAEAMAAGCVVVGFDGLGTAEYFDNDVGIPVTEGDIAALITAVEQTVAEYEADPSRLDTMRHKASERVNMLYSVSAFQNGVLNAWNQFNDILDNQGL